MMPFALFPFSQFLNCWHPPFTRHLYTLYLAYPLSSPRSLSLKLSLHLAYSPLMGQVSIVHMHLAFCSSSLQRCSLWCFTLYLSNYYLLIPLHCKLHQCKIHYCFLLTVRNQLSKKKIKCLLSYSFEYS
jgi:hypothetical protein